MKIDIAASTLSFENKHIIKEIRKRNIKSEWIDPRQLSYEISDQVKIFHKGKKYPIPDILLTRGGFARIIKEHGRLFISILESLGVKIIEDPKTIAWEEDTAIAHAMLAIYGIPCPKTLIISNKKDLKKIDFSPIVIKPTKLSQGKGIYKVDRLNKIPPPDSLVQEYIHAGGRDIRVLVINGKALGAMERSVAKKGEWRSNISLGGSGNQIKLTKDLKNLAIKAAKAVGIKIAGVDIIIEDGKLYVLEVNIVPQFKGFMKSTGIDVPKHIVDFLINAK